LPLLPPRSRQFQNQIIANKRRIICNPHSGWNTCKRPLDENYQPEYVRMESDWNDLAQSDKEGPSLASQILLIFAVCLMVMVFFLGM